MQVKTSILLMILYISITLTLAINQDGFFLQRVKLSLSDPTGFLTDWSDRNDTPCNWTGITCNENRSVVSVILSSAFLYGSFPILLCRLPFLTKLSLANNSINSTLPPSISSCRNLRYLDLSENYLGGPLPPTLSELHFLRDLNLESCSFSGEIPASFGHFRQLETLLLTSNYLSGAIPSTLGNITSLTTLRFAFNLFSSSLPAELGNLTNLEDLWLANNTLVGSIPDSLGQLSRLTNFDVSNNRLSGPFPSWILKLKDIVQVELYSNLLTGDIPSLGWSNLTELRRFDASLNRFTGTIPKELCELPLGSLNLNENQFTGLIPESIAKSPNLYELKLFSNRLIGPLPRELGKNSHFQIFDACNNSLSGEIPEFLCQHGSLEELLLFGNAFSGKIPLNLGKCHSLNRIRLHSNQLYGEIPAEFWGLPQVNLLELHDNDFSGNISHLIQGAKKLSALLISENKFSGIIPSEIGSLSTLQKFLADGNELSGEIPSAIVNLGQLQTLDLSNNQLSGIIPKEIQSMKQLNELDLAKNRLSGHIPDEIGNLPVLNYLDLSDNNFSGEIPRSLQNLVLNSLNLSNNHLSGNIPMVFAKGIYRSSFLGNPSLCMNPSGVCNSRGGNRKKILTWIMRSIFALAGIVFLVGVVWFALKYKKIKKGVNITKWTSFHKLVFNELEIIDSLKESNVIGKGASGKVYKVVLSNGERVAVKKLCEKTNGFDYDKDKFEAEVETLGKIRHKNIVRLWCCCKTGNYKLLVYEYMPKGSLGDFLHGENREVLDWPTRFKIALDSAEGLSYLHHDCVPPIVHRDVKLNNILLDEDFGAKISDFGVAKIFKLAKRGVESMSVIAGSYGYIAPEYAYTLRVNEKSDVYSFGIVILELVTGKPPFDPEFGEKDFANWVRTTFDQNGINQVLDHKLDSRFKQHIFRVLEIGLLCTSSLPVNRPSMRRVVNMLQELGDSLSSIVEQDGKMFPSFREGLK